MSPLAHAANIHIDLAAPNFGVQEWSGIEPPNFVIQELKGPHGALLEVFPGLPEFDNGYVYANDKPGLGVDLNEEEAAKDIAVRILLLHGHRQDAGTGICRLHKG